MQVKSRAVSKFEMPKCAAYEFVNGHCWPNKVKTTKKNPMKEKYLKKDHIMPGHMVSAYNYISRATGRLYQKKGKSYPSAMFSGGCVFI